MKQLVFLPSNTAQRPRKDQEIIQAVARSHAAKIGRPRKPKLERPRSYVLTPDTSRSATPDQQDDGYHPIVLSQSSSWARSLVQRGNSDPFQSFAIPITPRVSQLLSFYATEILPIKYSTCMVPSASNSAIIGFRSVEATDDYHSVLAVLQDESSAVGFLLAQMTAMAELSQTQQHSREAMRFKARALAELKTQIAKPDRAHTALIESALGLLHAAVYAGDIAEARLHLEFVKTLLEERALRCGLNSIDIVLLFRVLYMDLAVSATYMAQTVLDVDRWVPGMLNIALRQTKPDFHFRPPPIAGFLSNIDASIADPLLTIFFECRRILWVWWLQPAQAVLESGPDIFTIATHPETYTFRWLYSQLYIYSCRLANRIASLQNDIPDLKKLASDAVPPESHALTRYIQRILSVALMALLGASCTKILVAGQPLTLGSELMLDRLKSALRPALTSLSESEIGRDYSTVQRWPNLGRTLLWCTFIGAAVERVNAQKAGGQISVTDSKAATPFSDQFVCVVKHMQLRSKEDVTELMKRFIYNEHMLPDAKVWDDALHGCGLAG